MAGTGSAILLLIVPTKIILSMSLNETKNCFLSIKVYIF